MHTITRVGLYSVKWGWMPPEGQTLTGVFFLHLTIERKNRNGVSRCERQSKIERGRDGGREGGYQTQG